jgi:hypothetical protein
MQPPLQELVDRLSARLGRAVLIDDVELQPLAYSSHTEPLDGLRTASILGRAAPAAARDALLRRGIATAHEAVHIGADPSIDMAARVCVPIVGGEGRWGYLWIIEDEPLALEQLEVANAAAREARAILASQATDHATLRARDQALLVDLVGGRRPLDELTRELAARRLLVGRPLAVCVVGLGGGGDGDRERDWLAAGMERLRRSTSAGFVVSGELEGGPACVATVRDSALRELGATSVGDALARAIHADAPPPGSAAVVGQSDVFDDLADAPRALRRARIALEVARMGAAYGHWAAGGPVARGAAGDGATAFSWDALGADRLLGALDPREALADLPPGLVRLLAPEHETLRRTLEAYLERAGDVKSTADALSLHRAGLYYRLARIEELADIDLHRGDDRLLCHVALRVARRAGR